MARERSRARSCWARWPPYTLRTWLFLRMPQGAMAVLSSDMTSSEFHFNQITLAAVKGARVEEGTSVDRQL